MKKNILILMVLSSVTLFSLKTDDSNRYFTKNGKVSFYSSTEVEDIEAHNNQVQSVLDANSGDIQFSLLIKSFVFEKGLMQKHFNSKKYMDSDKYPKSKFTGKLTNLSNVNFAKDGTYKVNITGQLTIKDKTNDITTDGTLVINGEKINATSDFSIKRSDYNIEVPKMAADKISDKIDIKVSMNYEKLKK